MKPINLNLQYPADLLDKLLDKITSYRLVLYLLYIYVGLGLVLALAGRLPFTAFDLGLSVAVLVVVCRSSNLVLARLFKLPANHESGLITALILSLILSPASTLEGFLILAAAGLAAIVSKYALTINRRHLLNPAAFGAFIAGVVLHSYASWWVGAHLLTPVLIIGAVLILRKMKHFQMFITFILVYVVCLIVKTPSDGVLHNLWASLDHSPLLFFGSVMLTEPLTSPTMLNQSLIYAVIVGFFYSVTRLRISPEESLLIGNLATYAMNPNRSQLYNFVGKRKEAEGIYSFSFKAPKKLKFKPGQYLEWTLPGVATDSHGNRRYLTIASSPTEANMTFSVKIPSQKSSNFKSKLISLKPGDIILASQLAGSFTLPSDQKRKLAFVAGGIGITPFHSMIKYLLDSQQRRDAQLFYCVNLPSEIAYSEDFKKAEAVGVKTSYIAGPNAPASWTGPRGTLSAELLKAGLPDYKQRLFYISGPQGFVAAVRQTLLGLGVKRSQINTDFFPGYN